MRGLSFLCRVLDSRLNCPQEAIRVNNSALIFVTKGWDQ